MEDEKLRLFGTKKFIVLLDLCLILGKLFGPVVQMLPSKQYIGLDWLDKPKMKMAS